jgi:hypothetical protein
MGNPSTEKFSTNDFPPFPMKSDRPSESRLTEYEFMKEDSTVRPMPRRNNTPGKAVIAAILIVLLVIAYTVAVILIPAYYFSRSDLSSMPIASSEIGADTVARAGEEDGFAPLADMMQSDATDPIAQEILVQDTDISPPIRLVEDPRMIEQHALGQG